jgi:hypothetical protein
MLWKIEWNDAKYFRNVWCADVLKCASCGRVFWGSLWSYNTKCKCGHDMVQSKRQLLNVWMRNLYILGAIIGFVIGVVSNNNRFFDNGQDILLYMFLCTIFGSLALTIIAHAYFIIMLLFTSVDTLSESTELRQKLFIYFITGSLLLLVYKLLF